VLKDAVVSNKHRAELLNFVFNFSILKVHRRIATSNTDNKMIVKNLAIFSNKNNPLEVANASAVL
jgi:hypothetical protein